MRFTGFEWDAGNREKNIKKHGVHGEEIETVFFNNPFVFPDVQHSTEKEERYVLLGETLAGKLLLVAFTLRGDKVRVISARPMSRKERSWYETEKEKNQL